MSINRRQLFLATVCAIAGGASARAETPAYYKNPPKGKLPPTKDPGQYIDKPVVQRVYELAAEIRSVLYQLPCYCSCDKFAGHGSLLDCFVDAHGEECGICQREAAFAYRETKAGKTPAEIRKAVIAGEWKNIDMRLPVLKAL